MKTIIVCSLNDSAGTNIRERLIERHKFAKTGETYDSSPIYALDDFELVSSHKDIVYVDDLDDFFDCSRYVFISRHRAESGIASLTAHFTGNFGEGEFGGRKGELARFSPSLLKNYFMELNFRRKEIPETYNLTLEATHHGPTSLRASVLFVELGSTPEQWVDTFAAGFVADALISALRSHKTYNKCAVAIGGTHYPDKFNRLLLESDMALGPVIPKYALRYFDAEMLQQILKKSDQPIRYAVVDQKGLGQYKELVLNTVKQAGLEVLKA